MKRTACIILSMLLALAAISCAAPAAQQPGQTDAPAQPAQTAEPTPEPTPDPAAAWEEQYRKGRELWAQEKEEEAIAAFEAAIKTDKTRPEAYLAIARIIRGDLKAAMGTLLAGQKETGSDVFAPILDEIELELDRQQDAVIAWEDPELEELVRGYLKKPKGEITRSELDDIKSLTIIANAPLIVNDQYGDTIDWERRTDTAYYLVGDPKKYDKKNTIKKLDDLYHFRNLDYLSLWYGELSDISGLRKAPNVGGLAFYHTEISDISALSSCYKLGSLDLVDHNISDISPLADLLTISHMKLAAGNIEDISLLADFKRLDFLEMNDNRISDISPLAELTKLQRLTLGNNLVSDLSPLSGLQELTDLELVGNPVTDVSALASLKKLQRLDIRGLRCDDTPVRFVPELVH